MKLYTKLSTLSTGISWGKAVYNFIFIGGSMQKTSVFLEKTNEMMIQKRYIL